MSKAENRIKNLKQRADENARLQAKMKETHRLWGGFLIGDKNNWFVTNVKRGIKSGGRR